VIPKGDAKTKCPNRFAIPHFYFPSLMKVNFQRSENKNVPKVRDILFCGETGSFLAPQNHYIIVNFYSYFNNGVHSVSNDLSEYKIT